MPAWNAGDFDALVFDMDDTLYPERDYVLSGFSAVAEWAEKNLGISAVAGERELRRLFHAGVRGDTFNRWLGAHDLGQHEDALIPRLVAVYREHKPSISPFPGVRAALEKYHRRYRLGLVSDGYLAVQQRKLQALGLADCFDAVVFSDTWGREAWKPSTKPFTAVLERLGVAAERTVYIADNVAKDFLGARKVGMATIWFRHPAGEYSGQAPPSPRHAPDLSVSSWDGLQKIL